MSKTAKSLRGKAIKEVTIKDKDGEEHIFRLRGISGRLVMNNYRLFNKVDQENIEMDTDNLTDKDVAYVEEKISPLLEVVLPKCCVEPRIVNDPQDPRLDGDDPTAIEFDDLGPEMMLELFNKIFEMAGMTKEGNEERKKLPSQSGQKT